MCRGFLGSKRLARQGKQCLQQKTAALLPRSPAEQGGSFPARPPELWCAWKDYTNPRVLNMDEEKKLQARPSNGSASGQEEDAECAKTIKRRLASNKKAIIVISHLIVGAVFFFLGTLVPLNYQKNAVKCPSVTCPFDWIGHQGHCYNISEEEKNWKESQKFCMSHNASLAKITKEEMNFVTNLTRNHVFWIGLKREPEQPWKWLDGENSTLEVRGDGGDCAYLDNDANSGTCSIEHRYICKKNDFMRA